MVGAGDENRGECKGIRRGEGDWGGGGDEAWGRGGGKETWRGE